MTNLVMYCFEFSTYNSQFQANTDPLLPEGRNGYLTSTLMIQLLSDVKLLATSYRTAILPCD
ncbi:MAG: hypothetical protein ACI8QD_000510 [Cyclobacteriaceae bacterium]|jgi:hypothetical protein